MLRDAEGSMPREPPSMEASSDRMSPKMLPVTTVSKYLGLRSSCGRGGGRKESYMTALMIDRHVYQHSVASAAALLPMIGR